MAWGAGRKPDEMPDPDSAAKTRYAAPPPCPRCELTKGQMNRTIQNYQKAYRKKVEGLKTELSSVRADNTQLHSQVRRLRRKKMVHLPSLAMGIAFGCLVARHLGSLVKRITGAKTPQPLSEGVSTAEEKGNVVA